MSNEKSYLEELGRYLNQYRAQVQALPQKSDFEALRKLLQELLEHENRLRKTYQIGERFRVIRSQIELLKDKFEKEVAELTKDKTKTAEVHHRTLAPDEQLVYVYLFNAQGRTLKTWSKLFAREALSEHSVNRPIYTNREDIVKFLNTKPNKEQHAFLEIAVKKEDVLPVTENQPPLKDSTGFDLLRLREGALKVENIYSFLHNGQSYQVVEGEIQSHSL